MAALDGSSYTLYVTSYTNTMARRTRLSPSRMATRRRKRRLFSIGIGVVLLAAFIGGTGYLSEREEVTVREIVIRGNSVVSEEELRGAVSAALEGTYLFLFPKRNVLWYPRGGVEAAALSAFPRLKTADVVTDDLQKIVLTVEERVPQGLWCGDEYKSPSGGDRCYFLDDEGFIYADAPEFSGNVFFRYFGTLPMGDPVIGQQFLEPQEFERLAFFRNALREVRIETEALSLVDDIDIELYLESGGKVVFDRDQSLSEVLDTIQAVFSSEAFKRQDLLSLDYVDLRFGNKVFYKFKK